MKGVKITLGIIIVLSIIFFGTGLIVKETKYTSEVEVDNSINEVFAMFEDTETLKQWLPEVKSIEPINETPQKLGSTYKMIVENQGQEIEMIEKIIAYVPNEKMTFHFTSDGMIKTDDYNFSVQGGKTKIVQNSTIKSNSYMLACVFPWMKSKLKNLSQDYMNRFKELVEKPTSIVSDEVSSKETDN